MSTNPTMHKEAFNLLCEDLLYSGMSREVWSSLVLADCVIKVEDRRAFFQNVIEWETWQRVKNTSIAKWFAPCRWISPNGSILVMERTRPAADRDYPATMPIFLNDFKRRNYGMIGKRLVCHDYGISNLMDWGMSKRMVKAKWSDNP